LAGDFVFAARPTARSRLAPKPVSSKSREAVRLLLSDRVWGTMTFTPSRLLILVSVVVFVLAAFGVTFGDFGEIDMIALGLGFFAAGHLV
jgi:hypothetical protein